MAIPVVLQRNKMGIAGLNVLVSCVEALKENQNMLIVLRVKNKFQFQYLLNHERISRNPGRVIYF